VVVAGCWGQAKTLIFVNLRAETYWQLPEGMVVEEWVAIAGFRGQAKNLIKDDGDRRKA
jgi:hypothetical protein